MKEIEVKAGDPVLFEGEKWTVQGKTLNAVLLVNSENQQRITSYSQIEKHEPEQIDT